MKLRPRIWHLLMLCPLLLCHSLLAQNPQKFKIKEVGTPFITNYFPTEYGAHEQSYMIDQADNGLLYFSNVTGIIEFDGQQWNVDSRVSDDAFRDVGIGPDGRIYAITKGLIGYFEPDSLGQMKFNDLRAVIPDQFEGWGNIWQIDIIGRQVIFNSPQQIVLYNIETEAATMIEAKGRFGRSGVVNGEYYVLDYSLGLLKLRNGQLGLVPGSEPLRKVTIRRMVSFSNNELLLVSQKKGLFILGPGGLRTWSTQVDDFFAKYEAFSAESINNEYFAIGTVRGGLVILNKEGRLIQKLDKSMGMGNDGLIQDVFLDKDQNLWVTQHGVISHIIINSAFTTIDERHGVNGYVLYFQHHQGKTYVSTTTGTVVKDDARPWHQTGDHKAFQPISNDRERVWMSVKKENDFFLAGNNGLTQVLNGGLRPLYTGERLWAAVALKNSPYMVLGSIEGNLFLFSKKSGRWRFVSKIKGFNKPMDFLEQTADGDLWMTDSGTGVFKIRLTEEKDSVVSIRAYGENDGLPTAERNRVFRHKSGLFFATAAGVYRYEASGDRFEEVPKFNKHIKDDYVFRFIEMANGDIYAALNPRGKSLLKYNKGEYDFTQVPFQRITGHNSEYVSGMGSNDIWIAGTGIKHYSWDFPQPESSGFAAHIRSIRVSNQGDSLLFAGGGEKPQTELHMRENALEFTFTAAFYDKIEDLEYQSYLEGSEDDWAPWTSKPTRNYTNLPHGTYTFKVRARNIYGQISEVDEFDFIIITPWHLTIWAYILYSVFAVVLVWTIVKLNARRLEKEKANLEMIVDERTAEIRTQKEKAEEDKILIQQQADRLKEMDKVKSRFFANISHELRTPLTLINAPLESLIQSEAVEDQEILATLKTAQKNGIDLLSLVEEILDLGKIDAGKLRLTKNPTRLKEFLTEILKSYQNGTEQKQIEWTLEFGLDDETAILMDENKCGKVIRNLLSNALKFTNNKVAVRANKLEDGLIQVTVEDNGIGIHPDDLPNIFDRYYQSEQPGTKASGGTGIGLALAKELAQLHDGDLEVESRLGEGSRFTFKFYGEEVAVDVISPISEAFDQNLDQALKETIDEYTEKFQIDKPVLLITEDHPEMRAFVAKTLSPYFKVKQAENGKVALGILNSAQVDIVISDVMMPEMDGFELLEAIKQNESLRQVSIVMLTARADREDKLYALTMGIDDYLTKPFSAQEFLARIKNILENRIKIIRELRIIEESTNAGKDFDPSRLKEKYDLSSREIDVMKLLAKRYTNAEIAEELFVSTNTVKFHIKNLFTKLDISSRLEAAEKIEDVIASGGV